ncbi:MAG: hypothetical protein ACYC6Y_09830, partial [Thermoguttaceae bacterium]
VIEPAEARWLKLQDSIDQAAADICRRQGDAAAEAFLTAYAGECLREVETAYDQLVDYLLLRYLVGDEELTPPNLPAIALPPLPETAPATAQQPGGNQGNAKK